MKAAANDRVNGSAGRRRSGLRDGSTAEGITRIAARLFADKGYAGTSTREIAETAGIRQPTIFHHFSSKEDIFRAILDRTYSGLLSGLQRIEAGGGTAPARLFLGIHFVIRYGLANRDAMRTVSQVQAMSPNVRAAYRDRDRAWNHTIRELIAEGVARGVLLKVDVPTAATLITGMCAQLLRQPQARGGPADAALADQVARHALRMLLVEPADLDAIATEAYQLNAVTAPMDLT